ncbi:MAG: hypothetical protein ACREDY_00735, partial [Bradyrhizobium sp.]
MTIERYNAAEAEPRWQKVWDERGIFATANRDLGKKYYVLEMFPYPSGRSSPARRSAWWRWPSRFTPWSCRGWGRPLHR